MCFRYFNVGLSIDGFLFEENAMYYDSTTSVIVIIFK